MLWRLERRQPSGSGHGVRDDRDLDDVVVGSRGCQCTVGLVEGVAMGDQSAEATRPRGDQVDRTREVARRGSRRHPVTRRPPERPRAQAASFRPTRTTGAVGMQQRQRRRRRRPARRRRPRGRRRSACSAARRAPKHVAPRPRAASRRSATGSTTSTAMPSATAAAVDRQPDGAGAGHQEPTVAAAPPARPSACSATASGSAHSRSNGSTSPGTGDEVATDHDVGQVQRARAKPPCAP